MTRRLRRIELNDELYFSNAAFAGTLVLDVDTRVDDEGPHFRRRDVRGFELRVQVGKSLVDCRDRLEELTADWLTVPGNLQYLARTVEWVEQRDPTRRLAYAPW